MTAPTSSARYEGSAFLRAGGRAIGTIQIFDAVVHFESSRDGVVELPLQGISIRSGGASDRLIFFEHPSVADTSIYTSDKSILSDPALSLHSECREQVTSIRSSSRRRALGTVTILALIVSLVLALVVARGPIVAFASRQVPPEAEKTLGEVAMRQILLGAEVESDPAVTGPMQDILAEVTAGLEASPYEFTLVVIRDETINAFALPGGQIAIHTGLIASAQSSEEIAGVLAHEVAHVTEQHSLRQMISTIGVFALVQAVFGDVSGIVAAAAEGGSDLLVLQFSRDAELDADRLAVETLTRARIDPNGMLNFFGTMKAQKNAASAIPAFLSTHPATDERIELLRSRIANVGTVDWQTLDIDLEAAQNALLD